MNEYTDAIPDFPPPERFDRDSWVHKIIIRGREKAKHFNQITQKEWKNTDLQIDEWKSNKS